MKRPINVVTDILAPSLGTEVAKRVVQKAASSLRLPNEITHEEALKLLGVVIAEPGIVGVAGRFAAARIHLTWNTPPGA